jgi:hypothetical protein
VSVAAYAGAAARSAAASRTTQGIWPGQTDLAAIRFAVSRRRNDAVVLTNAVSVAALTVPRPQRRKLAAALDWIIIYNTPDRTDQQTSDTTATRVRARTIRGTLLIWFPAASCWMLLVTEPLLTYVL